MARLENGGLSPAEMAKYFGTTTEATDKEGVPIMENPRPSERPTPPSDRAVTSISRESQNNNRDVLKSDLSNLNNEIRNFLISGRSGVMDRVSVARFKDAAESIVDQKNKIKGSEANAQFDDIDNQLVLLADNLTKMGMEKFAEDYIRPKTAPMRRAA